jgi:hypothetical protein
MVVVSPHSVGIAEFQIRKCWKACFFANFISFFECGCCLPPFLNALFSILFSAFDLAVTTSYNLCSFN